MECTCPEVWSGHGEPKPDPKRVSKDCPIHYDPTCAMCEAGEDPGHDH